ncbi:MAG: hypothetical protein KC800_05950 [Candidatus Eremiobacteraeota bacterium]|nr:hypothetical protein [Candidatus Eremiobacteraeota bacterium]
MELKNKKVYIYSVEKESATGIDKWINESSGRSMKKTKIGVAKSSLKALYSSKVGGLANYISYTPWLDENGAPMKDDKGNTLTLQDKEEKFWNKPKGYFNNTPRTREDNTNQAPITYFQRMEWAFNDGSTVLDLNLMDDRMCYYMCLESKYVANSEKELKGHKFPYAEYFIAIENESDELKYAKTQQKVKAFASLFNKDMTPITARKFTDILGLSNTQAILSQEQIQNLLYEYIDKSGYTGNSNIQKYDSLFNLLRTAPGREELEARHLLKRAEDARVIYSKAGTYTWVRPEGKLIIGDKHSEAIDFLTNPKKLELVEDIIKQIEARTL